MIHPKKTTPFQALGAEWELITIEEMPDQVFARMLKSSERVPFDGKMYNVRYKSNRKDSTKFPCIYVRTLKSRRAMTLCIPIKEWRDHNDGRV